jgi:hypothetical protein
VWKSTTRKRFRIEFQWLTSGEHNPAQSCVVNTPLHCDDIASNERLFGFLSKFDTARASGPAAASQPPTIAGPVPVCEFLPTTAVLNVVFRADRPEVTFVTPNLFDNTTPVVLKPAAMSSGATVILRTPTALV